MSWAVCAYHVEYFAWDVNGGGKFESKSLFKILICCCRYNIKIVDKGQVRMWV